MSVNGKIIYLIGCALLLSIDSFSRTIYVSEKSDGNGNGNIDKPLASIEIALRRAQAGDVIEILPGSYREVIKTSNKHDIVIKASEPGTVKILGNRLLPKNWAPSTDGIWKQVLQFDIWQLFNEGENGICSSMA